MKWQHETHVIACQFVLPSCRRLVHMTCKYTCSSSLYAHVIIPCYVGMGFIACIASQITSVQVTDITQHMHNYFCCVLLHFLSVLFSKLGVSLSLQCTLLAPHCHQCCR